MNILRMLSEVQRTCALHRGQHRIAGRWTESISTYDDRRLGQGDHRNLHKVEIRSSMLTAPDRVLTRSSYLFSGPTKGGRKRSNARRGGCSIPTWLRGRGHDA